MEGKNNNKTINKSNFKIAEDKKDNHNKFSNNNDNSDNKNNNTQKYVLNASINMDITLSDDIFKSIGLDDNKNKPIKKKIPIKPKHQNSEITRTVDDNKRKSDAEYEKFINRKKIKK